jgi:hypothetical protein
LVSLNFGLGYNKSANFYKRARLKGYDSPISSLDMFEVYANEFNLNPDYLLGDNFQKILPEDWTTAMAFAREMIRYENGKYFQNGLSNDDKVDIYRSTLQSGGTNEYTFSLGGNISNKFQFGLTIGVQNLELINSLNYNERYIQDLSEVTYKYISSLRDEYTRTTGYGINAKFGIIYRPIDAFRLGFAIHTPTFFNLEREYKASITHTRKKDNGITSDSENSPSDIYEYTLTTPYRLEFGMAYIFGRIGLISIDYELVGNNSMRIGDNIPDNSDYIPKRNDAIKNIYRATSNIRIGAEINLPHGLMVRAGFNHFQSPYKDSGLDFSRYAYSGGIGYRNNHFSVDLAYMQNTGKYHFGPYFINNERFKDSDKNMDVAVENSKTGRIIATIGFKF